LPQPDEQGAQRKLRLFFPWRRHRAGVFRSICAHRQLAYSEPSERELLERKSMKDFPEPIG
jgi:hypothetical protein